VCEREGCAAAAAEAEEKEERRKKVGEEENQQRALGLPYISKWIKDFLSAVIPQERGRLLDDEGGLPLSLSVSLIPYRMDAYA
jgi:hypothetical protein